MGRQKMAGLRYFSLDTDFFEDKRIRRLTSRFGADGPLFYLYILCKAYERGYCVEYNDDFEEDAALDLGCSTEKIGLMLHYLLDKSLLDSTLFDTVKVLSSHGIQTQYQVSKKGLKRDVEVNGSSWILDESETEGFIKVRHSQNKSGKNQDKSGKNQDKSGKNDTKEKKGKESKINQRKESENVAAPPRSRDSRNLIFLDDAQYSTLLAELGEAELKRCIDYLSEYCSMHNKRYHDWPAVIRKASRERWGMRDKSASREGVGPGYAPGTRNFQPSAERIRRNNEWLEKYLEEQRRKELEEQTDHGKAGRNDLDRLKGHRKEDA